MKYFKLPILVLLMTLGACETDADVSSLLDHEQLIVINGYISPQDETIIVQVSRSISKFSNAEPPKELLAIDNAQVVISDSNSNQVDLTYNPETFQYEIISDLFSIEAGQRYFLSVTVDEEEYTATANVPADQVADIDKDFFTDPFGIDMVRIKFSDIPNKQNYYVVGIDFSDGEQELGSTFFYGQRFIADANQDGSTLTSTGEINFFTQGSEDEEIAYRIQVANVERILQDALRASFLFSDGEDILIEPVVFPTNIDGKNGFGVFAGYNLTEKEEIFTP